MKNRKKILGQYFLTSKNILNQIIEISDLSRDDIIIEVGPGKGILTRELLNKVKKVFAIEKDIKLVEYLKEDLKDYKNIKIIQKDILKISEGISFDLKNALKKDYKIVANLPYYITSRFLRLFISPKMFKAPKSIIIIVQKEVGQRICAPFSKKKGKMSLLALSIGVYGKPLYIKTVKSSAFSPKPNVDSAIIKIERISDEFFKKNDINSDKFFNFAKKAFNQKRKQLKNSLKKEFDSLDENSKNKISNYMALRPEDLSISDWKKIYFVLNKIK